MIMVAIQNLLIVVGWKVSASLVRKAADGHATSDGIIEISNTLVKSTLDLSPSLVRKAHIAADGNIEISNSHVEAMQQISPARAHEATEGQVTADGSIEISIGGADPMLQISPGVAHKRNELGRTEGKKVRHNRKGQKQTLMLHPTISGRLAEKYRTPRQKMKVGKRPRSLHSKLSNASNEAFYALPSESQGRELPTAVMVSPSLLDVAATTSDPLMSSTTAQAPMPSPQPSSTNSDSYMLNLLWICIGLVMGCLIFFALREASVGYFSDSYRIVSQNLQSLSPTSDVPGDASDGQQIQKYSFTFRKLSIGSDSGISEDTDSLPDATPTASITPVQIIPPTPHLASSDDYREDLSKKVAGYRPMFKKAADIPETIESD